MHGLSRHPQTQGAAERFNGTKKEILKTRYILKVNVGEEFDLKKELLYSNKVYNETIHFSIGLSPLTVFHTKDNNILVKIKERTIKSPKYTNKNVLLLPDNSLGLLYENFRIANYKLLIPNFGGKGRYILPINIIKNISSNEYLIKISIAYKFLKTNIEYFADYPL